MKLYVGGVCQGQDTLAKEENPGAEMFFDFHETIREILKKKEDPREFARLFCEAHPDAIVIANEVGAGVVPIVPEERAFREGVGRALCIIAQNSQTVVRSVCGIGVKIK